MKHLATTLAAAVTLYAVSPSGLAATASDELHREVVTYADLDLARPAGAQQLYQRIERAAHLVCPAYGPGGYERGCVHEAIARAVAEVGAPLLTAHQQTLAHRQSPPRPRQAPLDR